MSSAKAALQLVWLGVGLASDWVLTFVAETAMGQLVSLALVRRAEFRDKRWLCAEVSLDGELTDEVAFRNDLQETTQPDQSPQ
jgi:hypothetical protein